MACDPFWNQTVLACHFDGTNGSTTFTDEKGHALTANGNAQISTAQSKFGGSSGYFDGTGDYLTCPYSSDHDLTGEYTVECFFRLATVTFGSGFIFVSRASAASGVTRESAFYLTSATNAQVYYGVRNSNSVTRAFTLPATLIAGQWYHIAFTRNTAGTMQCFLDGVASASSYSDATSLAGNLPLTVGAFGVDYSMGFNGYIDDLRITKAARYTDNFTVPTEAFPNRLPLIGGIVKDSTGAVAKRLVRVLDRKTCSVLGSALSDATTGAYSISVPTTSEVMVVANDTSDADPYWSSVVLALHCDGPNGSTTFTDEKGETVTASGNAKISTAQSKFGEASAYLDGAGDYLTVPASPDLIFGTGDFTIEFQIYPLAYGGTVCGPQLFGTVNGSQSGWSFHLGQNQDTMRMTSNLSGAWADNFTVSAGGGPALNTWSHIAIVRSGANVTIYKNGTSVGSTSSAAAWNFGGGPFIIGRFYDGTNTRELNGYIDDLRVTKGVARYTGNFTPPTAAFPNSLTGGTENAVILDRVVPA